MKSFLHYLKVYPLPIELTLEDRTDFFKLFGAEDVKHVSVRGKKQAALVGFKSPTDCRHTVSRLHQMKVLLRRLNVILHKEPVEFDNSEDNIEAIEHLSKLKEFEARLTPITSQLTFNSPIPSSLKYKYPEITPSTIANISNAIVAVPKLYTQVLHLMNKMNLPPPFGESVKLTHIAEQAMTINRQIYQTTTDESREKNYSEITEVEMDGTTEDERELVCKFCKKKYEKGKSDSLCSSESELESDSDTVVDKNKSRADEIKAKKRPLKSSMVADGYKRARLQLQQDKLLATYRLDSLLKSSNVESAFSGNIPPVSNKLKLNIPSTLLSTQTENINSISKHDKDTKETDNQFNIHSDHITESIDISQEQPVGDGEFESSYQQSSSGFGKIEAINEESSNNISSKYISLEELENNKVKESEYPVVPVLSKYNPGDANSRLYIKNLAKNTTTQHLRFIYDRFSYAHYRAQKDKQYGADEEESIDLMAVPDKYHIELMHEGKLRWQAFITLPSISLAEEARKHTNGYILNDKPMVVYFANPLEVKNTNK